MKNKYNEILKAVSSYRRRSIFFKYMRISIIALFIPFLLINILIFANNVFSVKDKIRQSQEQTLLKSNIFLEELFKSTDKNASNIFSSKESAAFLNNDLFSGSSIKKHGNIRGGI